MARRWQLFVVVTVLSLAPMRAWAECAWVLWFQVIGPDMMAAPGGAWPTRAECERERAAKDASATPKMRAEVLATCLPDTIDPRGPKATGR
jgi:hypothetical protein